MLVIGILSGVVGIGFLCRLVFNLVLYGTALFAWDDSVPRRLPRLGQCRWRAAHWFAEGTITLVVGQAIFAVIVEET
ncbi:MAG: hypothetical protein ACYC5H_13890 [Methylovirgula sp.]